MGGGIVVNESWQREEQLFTDALARPRGERAAFVARACAGDERLRALVEKLLEEHEQADFLETPAAADLTDAARTEMADDGAALEVGTQIGRYRLREPIGEGGCGLVYRAEQAEPVRREVALKIIKLGLDTREVVGRFEAERQALAMMEHPNIARVFDGGATATGRPFFVMELVRGRKITEHCDAAKAPLQPRLRLFLQVCRAVQHAHQKGIIHRDLKPSNILVLELDGAPVVKVIDFGVAKAIEGRLAERTWWTRVEQFVGTPAYMSPEQAAGTRDDLDTRTDIYSLGVLLYELLVGCTPLDGVALRDLPGDEIRRRIRETEPPRPSVRFRGLEPPTQAQVAHGRGVEPKRLAAHVSGELEWIVMRCLEHDRARRYEAVSGLAEDLERHLAGEPVLARPPTTRYLARKFVGRHRVAFAVGGVVALSLIAGVTVATALYVRAAHAERDQARLRLRAELEAARSRQVVQFVGGMLQGVEPAVARGRDPAVVKDLLDDTVARLDDERELEPEIEADLRTLVGGIYLHIGQPTAAERMQRVALALRIASLGPTHPKVAESLDLLGDALSGQRLAVAAIVCHREALAIGEECFGRDAAEIMPTLLRLAETTVSNGRFADGRRYYERAQAIQRRHTAPDDPARARIAFDLARLTMFEGKAAEAEAQMRACLAAYRLPETRAQAVPPTIAPPPPWLLPLTRDEVWQTLSWALRDDQRYPEAEAAA
ncbi:MAG TPA: serine/threonine-protein kinase, partial [Opitutus sp.]|nr:serine/threonine-protein kinase [Opitutus sp.]